MSDSNIESTVTIASQKDITPEVWPASRHSNESGSTRSDLITTLSIDSLRDALQTVGYRVESVVNERMTYLRSATGGMPFDIRPGNGVGTAPDQFVDVAFVALFAVRGTFSLEIVNEWNRSRRFGRLFVDRATQGQEVLVFALDVSVAGGVTPIHFRSQIEVWDSLVQQFVSWLRVEVSKIAPGFGGADASSAKVGEGPAKDSAAANTPPMSI